MQFGEPTTITGTAGETGTENYRTHRKIRDNSVRTMSLGMGVAMKYGLAEIYAFSHELFIALR